MNPLAGLLAVIIIVVPGPPGGPEPDQANQPRGVAPSGQVSSVPPMSLVTGNGPVVRVTDPVSLETALAKAEPGQTIEMADGMYNGRFTIGKAGEHGKPITLHGSHNAIINGGDTSGGDAVALNGANFWQLVGFTVTGGQKGIVADRTNSTTLSGLDVGNTGAEGVRIGNFSSNNALQNSVIHDTGKAQPGSGEGLILGTAQKEWPMKSNGQPDHSNGNRTIDNTFKNTASENIEVSEETSGGTIAGNSFDASGLCGVNLADSVLDVKGAGYRILNNLTSGTSPHVKSDFQTQVITSPATSGCGNTFLNNVFIPPLTQVIILDPRCVSAGSPQR